HAPGRIAWWAIPRLVHPAVGAGRRFVLVLVDVDLELFAVALVFPVGDFVAEAIEGGVAAEGKIANEQSAQVADVRNPVIAQATGSEEGDGGHEGANPFHHDGDRNRKKIGAAIGKENRAGDQNAENRARGTDGGDVISRFAPQHRDGAHDYVENAGADSGEKV